MAQPRNYNPATREAARLLGAEIRLGRVRRGFTQAELAGRVGVTDDTMRKIERGDLGVSIGSVFEAAVIAGVSLFDRDPERRAREGRRVRDLLALMPSRVDEHGGRVRDDF